MILRRRRPGPHRSDHRGGGENRGAHNRGSKAVQIGAAERATDNLAPNGFVAAREGNGTDS